MTKRVVLAYSGGLDTSVAVRWIQEEWGAEVVALAVDVGQQADDPWDVDQGTGRSRPARSRRAVVDARAEFADDFLVPAIHANALYEGKYPLVSALSRPVIARHLVLAAREFGADAVAHGCTGKGNDQVRFEVSVRALAPDLDVLAPVRVWGFTREDSHRLRGQARHPDQRDQEEPVLDRREPLGPGHRVRDRSRTRGSRRPIDAYALTAQRGRRADARPARSSCASSGACRSRSTAWSSRCTSSSSSSAPSVGAYGFGRLDMVENRRVGIKSRETYECPGSLAVLLAHADLESITLERDLMREKARLEPRYAELVYDGLWYSPLKEALDAFMGHAQEFVTGEVRLRLEPGRCFVAGRRADRGLYSYDLATYDAADTLPPRGLRRLRAAVGPSVETWAREQGGPTGRRVTAPARRERPLARPVRGGPGRRAAGVHREPVVRPAPRARRPRGIARARRRAGARRAAHRRRGRRGARRARPGRGTSSPTARSSSRRPTRTSTPPSSGGSPSSPGAAGAKLHTGRSRNDQVATALRLFLRREGTDVAAHVHQLQEVLRRRAPTQADDVYLPGYTHLQRAQPVLLAHHFLAHFWAFARDVDRWRDAIDARRRVAARRRRARRFEPAARPRRHRRRRSASPRRFDNSLDAVSDRDFVAEALFVAALTQVHLSRLGEEIVLWTSEEFGFLRLADAYSTGSSMLPQKKNPDIAELARGKAGRLIGDLTGFLATLKGLPLAYNRDLQEDKEPLFDALDQCRLTLGAIAGLLATAELVARRGCRRRPTASTPPPSTSPSGWCSAGVPFRDAHAAGRRAGAPVGRAGRAASTSWCSPNPTSAPRRWRCSSRARRCCAARRPVVPARRRSRSRC